jgi:hypothetical protein
VFLWSRLLESGGEGTGTRRMWGEGISVVLGKIGLGSVLSRCDSEEVELLVVGDMMSTFNRSTAVHFWRAWGWFVRVGLYF